MSADLELKPIYSIHPSQEIESLCQWDEHPSSLFISFNWMDKRYEGLVYPVQEIEEGKQDKQVCTTCGALLNGFGNCPNRCLTEGERWLSEK